MLKVICQFTELRDLIGVRNRRQNGLVIAPAHQFHLAAFHQFTKLLEIFRMTLFQPLEQNSGKMQAQVNAWMRVQRAHKRRIGFLVGIFDDVIEVSHRLVRMNDKSERDFTQFCCPFRRSRTIWRILE